MNRKVFIIFIACILAATLLLSSCQASANAIFPTTNGVWTMGFASLEIELPAESEQPLYIAGYRQGAQIEGVLDLQRASALWMDTGSEGILLIGIDCVGLSSGTVDTIRQRLKSFCREVNCASVNVYSTHTHAGVDTLGLWGNVAQSGKNDDFMENLIDTAVAAAKQAYEMRTTGTLYYGETETEGLQEDSRRPAVYDATLHQLRFVPANGESGVRLLFYAAHAESLRSGNRMVSRDFPGVAAQIIKQQTGDDTMFLPGAIGGLIMTPILTEGAFDAEENLRLTGQRLADYALSITQEREIAASIAYATQEFEAPLDNTLFMYYRFLGILDVRAHVGQGETGYSLFSSLSLLQLGGVLLTLLPCEIFPELVYGDSSLTEEDPTPLCAIAARYGVEEMLVVGLCNDELGYVVPPSDFMIADTLPYVNTVEDATGENHYEETNSLGPATASCIAQAFASCIEKLTSQ